MSRAIFVAVLAAAPAGCAAREQSPAPARSASASLPPWAAGSDGELPVLADLEGRQFLAERHGTRLMLGVGTTGEAGRLPLFGLAAKPIARIRPVYSRGPRQARQPVRDGVFAVSIEADRRARALDGDDAAGRRVVRFRLLA